MGGSCRDLTVCPEEKDPIGLEIIIPAVSFSKGKGNGNTAGTLMYSESLKPFSMDSNSLSVCRQLVLGGVTGLQKQSCCPGVQVFETGSCFAGNRAKGKDTL